MHGAPPGQAPHPSLSPTTKRALDTAFPAVIGVGIVLRAIQYFSFSSLYIDEAAVGLNLRASSASQLVTAPLDFAQMTPSGFLLAQDLLVSALGEHEATLRLLPFVAGIIALLLFVVLARRILDDAAALTASALFAVSLPLIYFSANAKPYMVDVTVAVGSLLIGLELLAPRPPGRRKAIEFAAFGVVAPWLSHAALLVLPAVVLSTVWSALRSRRGHRLGTLACVFGAWTASGVAAYLHASSMLSPEGLVYMRDFWEPGFMPLPVRSLDDMLWLPATLWRVGRDPLGPVVPGVMAAALLLGLVTLPARPAPVARLLMLPVLVTLSAAVLGRYPFGSDFGVFSGRVILFLVPSFLLIIGSVIDWLRRFPKTRVAVASLLVLSTALPLTLLLPLHRDEIRPVLEQVAAHRQATDYVYVYYGARHVYDWYAPQLGLARAPAIRGVCRRTEPRAYIDDLRRIPAGSRVWVVMTHIVNREYDLVIGHLRRHAQELGRHTAPGATAELFQLPATPLSADASDLLDPFPANSRFVRLGCRGVFAWTGSRGG